MRSGRRTEGNRTTNGSGGEKELLPGVATPALISEWGRLYDRILLLLQKQGTWETFHPIPRYWLTSDFMKWMGSFGTQRTETPKSL